ncbi:MAG: uncharacterized protein K0R76_1076 [Alphaproteobacteria bacterium]|nr:uncharacterized protein [Alphaproteobacteria bacterium]MDF3034122.1 uncharacterized protein [Alphaproteobacteria bacterium]
MIFENKLVAVLNKDLEPGVVLNALAHISIGLGAEIGKSSLRLDDYKDGTGNIYPNISQIPFIILRAKSHEIRKTVKAAKETQVLHGVFLDTMTGGTYKEQLVRTAESKEEALTYYGCVLFGDWPTVSEMTRKFSLWK